MQKINELLTKFKEFIGLKVKPNLLKIDAKIDLLIPNTKIKKVAYIAVSSIFGFMFLIIILGIIISPLRNKSQVSTTQKIKKTATSQPSSKPQKELTDTEKEVLKLENKINEMTFPESLLNIPVIERDLSI